jgi:hypothetical protein
MVGFTVSNNDAPTPAYKFGTVVVKISTDLRYSLRTRRLYILAFFSSIFLDGNFMRNFRMVFEEMRCARSSFLFTTSRNELEEVTKLAFPLFPPFVAELCPGVLAMLSSSSSSDSDSESLSFSESETSESLA